MPPIEWLKEFPWNGVLILLMAEIAMVFIGGALIWAILKVRSEPVPAMLLITLGLLTLVSIIGFALTRYQVLGTLAAAGMGAIAGSLTNVMQVKKPDDPPKDKIDP